MKTKNAITVRPTPALSELKRASNLIRITEKILATPTVPARNRTDEHGRKHGQWVERFADGGVQEGLYVDGKRHGRWVVRLADGDVHVGPMVDGKRHGKWVFQAPDSITEGSYVEGKMHGMWLYVPANGEESLTCWKNGNKIDNTMDCL